MSDLTAITVPDNKVWLEFIKLAPGDMAAREAWARKYAMQNLGYTKDRADAAFARK